MPETYPWQFRILLRSELKTDPVQREFFAPQDSAAKLVRESIQNSLDAGQEGTSVRVRFSLREGAAAAPPPAGRKYLDGLGGHLAAAQIEVPDVDGGIPYLLVEDFGTRGLTGDPMQNSDPDSPGANSFYWFWRNVGRSGKGGSQRGRWGVGKWVFPAASQISTIFGLTVRHDDALELLMGQCVLKTHTIEGQEYAPYGFFGAFGPDGFQLPLQSSDALSSFKDDFGISRSVEPGLSIVIPFPAADITGEAIAQSVILNYFFPILSGDLTVRVEQEDHSWDLNADSLQAIARTFHWEGADAPTIHAYLELAKWVIGREPDVAINLNRESGAPRWRDDVFDAETLERLRRAHDQGDRLGIRVQMSVARRLGSARISAARWKVVSAMMRGVAFPTSNAWTIVHHDVKRGARRSIDEDGEPQDGALSGLVLRRHTPGGTGDVALGREDHGPRSSRR